MAIRLVKVAKDLNVGINTLVEHLKKKGFEVDNKPSAKVTDEMYKILLSDFKGSIAIKEQADLLTIGTRAKRKEEKEEKPVKETPVQKTTPPKKEKTPPKVVKTPPVEVKPEPPKVEEKPKQVEPPKVVEAVKPPVEKKEEPKAPTNKLKGPKVIDKIDLDAKKPKKAEVKKVEPKKTEAKKEKVEKKVADKKAADKPTSKPVAKVEKTAKPETKKTKAKENTPKARDAKKSIGKKEHKGKKKEAAKEVKKTKTAESNEFRAKTPTLKGLKILGKIDTDRLKKPERKKKTERVTPKLPGTKVVGKIDLGANKKKEGSSDAKKRKRKRKKVPSSASNPSNTRSTSSNSGGGRSRGNSNRSNSRRKKADEVKEVSKKEIEDKIKATMAQLSGGKSKAAKNRRGKRNKRRERAEVEQQEKSEESKKIQLTEFIPVSEFASLMDISVTEVIMTCMNLGVIVSRNQRLDAEVIELVASEFNFEIEFISAEAQMDIEEDEIVDAEEDLIPRAPIVTVMGHVDHGKTSLLDYIRNANVIGGEAGGITQHIGAYEVKVGEEKRKITFLDTPGHEAFTAMRARGAKATDVAVVIVSADDNVMPQTEEAIAHCQAAGVPMIFAINKIDKMGADPERIKGELAGKNVIVEEYGGEHQSQDISAKFGTNVDELLEKILLQADLLELKANPERPAQGVVLEASLDKGRGYVTKVLVQTGTLKIGDPVVAGSHFGKVRAMTNDRGKRIKVAGPSQPVLVLGMKGAPQAGEKFKVMKTEQEARQLATKRGQITSEQNRRATKRITLDDIGRQLALGSFKVLNLIVKGDVDGSIQALADSLIKLSTETVQVNIVHKAVGQIIESDANLAAASDAIIIGFQVRPSAGARRIAEKEGVQIKTYSVIYAAIEEIKSAIEGMLEPTKEEKITANVEVMETYKISKIGTIAGCMVREGKIQRNSLIRVIRDGIVIFPKEGARAGELASLKRYKDDIKEVKFGMECGLTIKGFNDIVPGDFVEAYEIIEVKQKLK